MDATLSKLTARMCMYTHIHTHIFIYTYIQIRTYIDKFIDYRTHD